MTSYSDITSAIRTVCSTIRIEFSGGGDGRLSSATKEAEYFQVFKTKMTELHPDIAIEISKSRDWYDVRVGGIPINLKLTTLGTDNCMNKKAVYYSLTGREDYPYASNWNEFWARIRDGPRKEMRVQNTEYHYLVVNKANGDFILKSILDMQNFRPNASNHLQIAWKKEFKVRDVLSDDDEYDQVCKDLLETIQTSVRMAHSTSANFMNADISSAW
jgi:hypothetical protein